MNLLLVDDLDINKNSFLFELADKVRVYYDDFKNTLSSKIIANIFFEPSTRTRLSFESAALKLGAKILSAENALENSSYKKGESIEDTIRIVQNYVDLIVLRHYQEEVPYKAKKVAQIPIINAGSGKGEHPTQALLDIYSIWRIKKKIDGISIAIIGDLRYGRAVHSLIKILAFYKSINIYLLSDPELSLTDEYLEFMKSNGLKFNICSKISDLPFDLDFIYQTRLQKERLINVSFENLQEFCLNKEIMKNFSKNTFIMHPLPRLNEISVELDEDPRCIIFEQAKNGLYIRMSILIYLFQNSFLN